MLSFPTRSLLQGAIQVTGDIEPDDRIWQEVDQRPLGGVRVTGRLSGAGAGRFYFSGKFAGSTLGECRRCLVEVQSAIAGEAHLLFAESETGDDDDPDVFPLIVGRNGSEVDLRPALREQWLLEVPAFVLCRPDCKGLCPTCGANLNQGACSHARKN
jgi:uncharacterized protein